MKCAIETITPSVAQSYLEKNTHNRRIREKHVYFLRDEIVDGRWQPNGATIVFSGNRLLDGQHRLLAVVAAKKPIKSLVVHGVPDEYFSTIDMGSPRRATDVLTIKGERHASLTASSAMWVIRYRQSRILRGHKTSSTAVEKFMDANQRIRESVELCHGLKIMSAPVAAACHYLFSQKDRTLADLFLDGIKHGCKVDRNDPVYLFRERMIENMASKAKLHAYIQMALMVKAWNMLRKDKKAVGPIQFAEGGAKTEEFPEIV